MFAMRVAAIRLASPVGTVERNPNRIEFKGCFKDET